MQATVLLDDKGRFTVPDDFDASDAEIEKAFYGAWIKLLAVEGL